MRALRDILVVVLGPVLATLVTFYPFERQELVYIIPNIAITSIPQVVWWLLCFIVARAVRKPVRGFLYGGIVGVDLLLLFMIWPWFFGHPRDEMAWLFYFEYAWVAILAGGVICGTFDLLRHKA
jgi:hypothetical protein